MKSLHVSICIPVYRGSRTLKEAVNSVIHQKGVKFDILIADDNNPDENEEIAKTRRIIEDCNDPRIRYIKTPQNQGYPQTMKMLFVQARGDVIFMMAQDDILAQDALKKTHDAFFLKKDIGAVTRPYFWFEKKISRPVRAILPPDFKKPTIISLQKNPEHLDAVIESIGQLSGLAMRRSWIEESVHHSHVFTCHVYPFLSIARDHHVVYLNDMTVAVRIEESQSRHVSSIYDHSPTAEWMQLFDRVFPGKKYHELRTRGREKMGNNALGLVQLKNYASFKILLREIVIMLQFAPKNWISLRFWFFCILSIVVPRSILRRLTDWYKRSIHARSLPTIQFEAQH